MTETRRCAGSKRDGRPCTATVNPPQTHCWLHDPANAEQRRKAASKAGKSRAAGGELPEIKRRLKELAKMVVDGELGTARGAVASQLLGTFLRACEIERKQRELGEVLQRIEELERLVSMQRGGSKRRWG